MMMYAYGEYADGDRDSGYCEKLALAGQQTPDEKTVVREKGREPAGAGK